jgi:hypothetical protein
VTPNAAMGPQPKMKMGSRHMFINCGITPYPSASVACTQARIEPREGEALHLAHQCDFERRHDVHGAAVAPAPTVTCQCTARRAHERGAISSNQKVW